MFISFLAVFFLTTLLIQVVFRVARKRYRRQLFNKHVAAALASPPINETLELHKQINNSERSNEMALTVWQEEDGFIGTYDTDGTRIDENGKRVWVATPTKQEVYEKKLGKLRELLSQDVISQAEFDQQLDQLNRNSGSCSACGMNVSYRNGCPSYCSRKEVKKRGVDTAHVYVDKPKPQNDQYVWSFAHNFTEPMPSAVVEEPRYPSYVSGLLDGANNQGIQFATRYEDSGTVCQVSIPISMDPHQAYAFSVEYTKQVMSLNPAVGRHRNVFFTYGPYAMGRYTDSREWEALHWQFAKKQYEEAIVRTHGIPSYSIQMFDGPVDSQRAKDLMLENARLAKESRDANAALKGHAILASSATVTPKQDDMPPHLKELWREWEDA